jgi:hypothetical protein
MPDNNLAETNGTSSSDSNGELERLRALAGQLGEENARLKQDLQRVQIERDDFLGALRYHDPNGFYTAEDLAEFRKNAISGKQLRQELEAIMREPL